MADSVTVQNAIDKLWASVIESMSMDLLRSEITFKLKYYYYDKWTHYTLTLSGVSSFYFANDNGEDRFRIIEYENGDILELTSMTYYPNGIGKIGIKDGFPWTKQLYSSANFSLEIWQRNLLIEAKQIEIVNVDENEVILRIILRH